MPACEGLTPKQEAFCRVYVETGNASEAYRRSYNVNPDCKPNTVEKRACELLKNGKVAGRVRQLATMAQKVQEEKFCINIETLTKMLLEDRALARENAQGSAAVSASKALGQLHGFFVDRKEIGRPGEFAELDELTDTDLADIARTSSSRAFAPKDGAAWSTGIH